MSVPILRGHRRSCTKNQKRLQSQDESSPKMKDPSASCRRNDNLASHIFFPLAERHRTRLPPAFTSPLFVDNHFIGCGPFVCSARSLRTTGFPSTGSKVDSLFRLFGRFSLRHDCFLALAVTEPDFLVQSPAEAVGFCGMGHLGNMSRPCRRCLHVFVCPHNEGDLFPPNGR